VDSFPRAIQWTALLFYKDRVDLEQTLEPTVLVKENLCKIGNTMNTAYCVDTGDTGKTVDTVHVVDMVPVGYNVNMVAARLNALSNFLLIIDVHISTYLCQPESTSKKG